MASAARKLATYADVLAAPEHLVAEVVDGDLYLQPRPARRHARASSHLGISLGGPFDRGVGGPGGWLIVDEPELHLGPEPQILVPDLAGWRAERAPSLDGPPYFDTAPDWVCEIASPSTRALDRGRKADLYAREGVRFLWLVDVIDRFVEAYELVGARWQRIGAFFEPEARIAPFDAIALDLAAVFGPPPASPPQAP
jgi:Uma2 family endonuclease